MKPAMENETLRAEVECAERERDEARGRCMDANAAGNDWRGRAEKAEAACAQMRAALDGLMTTPAGSSEERNVAIARAEVVLASDAGRELLERVERYERALREIAMGTAAADGRDHCLARLARAALNSEGRDDV